MPDWLFRSKRGKPLRLFPPNGEVPSPPPEMIASSENKGHGRVEKRTIRLTNVLTCQQKWKGLKLGFELKRRLLELTRGHWGIENELHYRRDVTLGEDGSRIRKGVAPQVMAALRNSVVYVLNDVVAPSLAAAVRKVNNCLDLAFKLLGLTQIE